MTTTSKTIPSFGDKFPIVFFGTEDFSATFLESLIKHKYAVKAVVTKPDTTKGRHQKLLPPAVKVIAEHHNIPVLQPEKLSSILTTLRALQPIAGVLVSYGKIIPKEILDVFTPGIINVHPSLLPKYRGPSPIEASILAGDTEAGISIMQLSESMDAGPIYHQMPVTLTGQETQATLYQLLAQTGVEILLKTLPKILTGALQPMAQDEAQATYVNLIRKQDGIIDMRKTAEQLEREIRAYAVWPRSRTTLFGHDVIVTKAHVINNGNVDNEQVALQTAQGTLVIDAVQPAGKKEMPIEAFLRGYKNET